MSSKQTARRELLNRTLIDPHSNNSNKTPFGEIEDRELKTISDLEKMDISLGRSNKLPIERNTGINVIKGDVKYKLETQELLPLDDDKKKEIDNFNKNINKEKEKNIKIDKICNILKSVSDDVSKFISMSEDKNNEIIKISIERYYNLAEKLIEKEI